MPATRRGSDVLIETYSVYEKREQLCRLQWGVPSD